MLVFKRVHCRHKQICKALCSHQPWQNQYYFPGRPCGCNNKVSSSASGCTWVWLLKIKLHFNLKTEEALGKTVRTLLFSVATASDLVLLWNHVSLTLKELSRKVGHKDLVPSGFSHAWNWPSWWQSALEGKWENGQAVLFEKLQSFFYKSGVLNSGHRVSVVLSLIRTLKELLLFLIVAAFLPTQGT